MDQCKILNMFHQNKKLLIVHKLSTPIFETIFFSFNFPIRNINIYIQINNTKGNNIGISNFFQIKNYLSNTIINSIIYQFKIFHLKFPYSCKQNHYYSLPKYFEDITTMTKKKEKKMEPHPFQLTDFMFTFLNRILTFCYFLYYSLKLKYFFLN
ncbi:hypothetical protein RFI_17622 [Reticulomyxa filosa]|uniref:Transmembrane protein n=1 Tax=Reticulomyxa filosa TaxID=46433 RepID=X6N1J6_RETFI|nr:hypothetical protein RFI_17622 [Reticulomyxa filosa]|eukprot:ETO19609.1 hypothetical protein RFI_17622 [Reticulomyxa filosa]